MIENIKYKSSFYWNWIKYTVTKTDTRSGKFFDIFIQFLIVISVLTFSIETLPNVDKETWKILKVIEISCVIIFTFEYIIRLISSNKKINFIFSFYGIIDLIAIVPFYISSGLDLRSVRSFRLLRVMRLLKLARYNEAMVRYRIAFTIIREELVLFLCTSAILIYMSAVGIYYFEHTAQPDKYASIFHSLWWAVGTLTTVAYGDVYPVTVGGKVFTFSVIIIGLGIVAVPTGLFASALTKAREISNSDNIIR
ncbi:ion transporter [Vibrio sp. TRT 21S02]|uniref:ion transporter n=1 Tax=Vibrio sp. TRT 21S02 TaxID=3418507 RepID=UPI003CE6A8A6